jgi:hypothetical protein
MWINYRHDKDISVTFDATGWFYLYLGIPNVELSGPNGGYGGGTGSLITSRNGEVFIHIWQ